MILTRLPLGQEAGADEALQKEASALQQDVVALIDSPLSDDQIELLWTRKAATGGNYRFRESETGRDLLQRINNSCCRWQQAHGSSPVDSDPRWCVSSVMSKMYESINGAFFDFPEHKDAPLEFLLGGTFVVTEHREKSRAAAFRQDDEPQPDNGRQGFLAENQKHPLRLSGRDVSCELNAQECRASAKPRPRSSD
ncbi:hypothetical protein ABZ769_17735 [Streptomyces olivoreticuli]